MSSLAQEVGRPVQLAGDIVKDTKHLVKLELELFRLQVIEEAQTIKHAAFCSMIGLALAVAALAILGLALAQIIMERTVLSPGESTLVVGGAFALMCGLSFLRARGLMQNLYWLGKGGERERTSD